MLNKKRNEYFKKYKDLMEAQGRANQLEMYKKYYGAKNFENIFWTVGIHTVSGEEPSDGIDINDPLFSDTIPEGYTETAEDVTEINMNDPLNQQSTKYTKSNRVSVAYGIGMFWEVDLTYVSSNLKVGLYSNDVYLDTFNIAIPPAFHYDSATGNIVFGSTTVKTIESNQKKLFIHLDSDLNIYFGVSRSRYYNFGSISQYVDLIKDDKYGIRFGYSIENETVQEQVKVTLSAVGIKEPSPFIKTWPNMKAYSDAINSWSLTATPKLAQNSWYASRVFDGNATSSYFGSENKQFTISFDSMVAERIVVVVATGKIFTQNNAYPDLTGMNNGVWYDSLSNKYFVDGIETSAPSSFPDITNGGQIYFDIRDNGDVYSSRDSSSAVLITSGYSSIAYETKTYVLYYNVSSGLIKLIPNNTQPIEKNPYVSGIDINDVDYFDSIPSLSYTSYPPESKSLSFDLLNSVYTNNTNTNTEFYYGVERHFSVDLVYANDTIIEIGFIGSGEQEEGFIDGTKPFVSYRSITGGIYFNGTLVKQMNPYADKLFFRVDDANNIYIGHTENSYYKVGDFSSILPFISSGDRGLRLAYHIQSQGDDVQIVTSTLSVYQNGLYHLTWPNYRGESSDTSFNVNFSIDVNSATATNKVGSSQIHIPFGTFKHTIGQYQTRSFTLKRNDAATITNIAIIIYNEEFGYTELFRYDSNTNTFTSFYGYIVKDTPNSLPQLDMQDGQIYIELNNQGEIYSSRDSSNKELVANTFPRVDHWRCKVLVLNDLGNPDETVHFSLIENNVQDIVSEIVPAQDWSNVYYFNGNLTNFKSDYLTVTNNSYTFVPVDFITTEYLLQRHNVHIKDKPLIPDGFSYSFKINYVGNYSVFFTSYFIYPYSSNLSAGLSLAKRYGIAYYDSVTGNVYIGESTTAILSLTPNLTRFYVEYDVSGNLWFGETKTNKVFIINEKINVRTANNYEESIQFKPVIYAYRSNGSIPLDYTITEQTLLRNSYEVKFPNMFKRFGNVLNTSTQAYWYTNSYTLNFPIRGFKLRFRNTDTRMNNFAWAIASSSIVNTSDKTSMSSFGNVCNSIIINSETISCISTKIGQSGYVTGPSTTAISNFINGQDLFILLSGDKLYVGNSRTSLDFMFDGVFSHFTNERVYLFWMIKQTYANFVYVDWDE